MYDALSNLRPTGRTCQSGPGSEPPSSGTERDVALTSYSGAVTVIGYCYRF